MEVHFLPVNAVRRGRSFPTAPVSQIQPFILSSKLWTTLFVDFICCFLGNMIICTLWKFFHDQLESNIGVWCPQAALSNVGWKWSLPVMAMLVVWRGVPTYCAIPSQKLQPHFDNYLTYFNASNDDNRAWWFLDWHQILNVWILIRFLDQPSSPSSTFFSPHY